LRGATALEGMTTTPAVLGIAAGIVSMATVLFSVRASRARDDLQRLILETASDAQAYIKVGFGS
jgi:hypothetical protein